MFRHDPEHITSDHRALWERLVGEVSPIFTRLCLAGRAARHAAGPGAVARVEPFGEQVLAWHAQGVEGQAIWQLLVEQHGFGGSYSSIKRFLRRVAPPTTRAMGARGDYAKQAIRDKLLEHKAYIARHGDDMPDITSWRWGARAASSAGASSTEADNV